MIEFKRTEDFDLLETKTIQGDAVALYVRHSFAVLANAFGPMPSVKKSTYLIKDVSGSSDGAGSEVSMMWHRRLTDDEPEKVRVKETPAELSKAFSEAGLSTPKIRRSMGKIVRDLKDAIFSPG